jgi:thioredoxin reductase
VVGTDRTSYDVIVIGGGVAGLSGALTLARARRTVLVVDDGRPRNAAAARVHGLLSQDGIGPWSLIKKGRSEVSRYGGSTLEARVELVRRDGDHFVVRTERAEFASRRLLIATGLVDELPKVAGLAERWGRDVVHCPYCHGWEIDDRPLGVLATGPLASQQALLFRQWTSDVRLLMHTAEAPTEAEREQLAARGIQVECGTVTAVEVSGDRLCGVRLGPRGLIRCSVLAVLPRLVVRADFAKGLGIVPMDRPLETGQYVPADNAGRTTVEGVWVAGDISGIHGGLVGSAAAGTTAAMSINGDLVAEDVRCASEQFRWAESVEPERTKLSGG